MEVDKTDGFGKADGSQVGRKPSSYHRAMGHPGTQNCIIKTVGCIYLGNTSQHENW